MSWKVRFEVECNFGSVECETKFVPTEERAMIDKQRLEDEDNISHVEVMPA